MKNNRNSRPVTFLSVILFLMMAGHSTVMGQFENHLILRKNGYIDKMHFLTGDEITLIRDGSYGPEEFYIQGIGTDFIVVSGEALPLSSITNIIHHRKGFNFRASGKALMLAAPGYLVIGVVNSLFAGTSLVPTATNLIVATTLLATGAALPSLQERNYRLGRRFSLVIVQSDPKLNR